MLHSYFAGIGESQKNEGVRIEIGRSLIRLPMSKLLLSAKGLTESLWTIPQFLTKLEEPGCSRLLRSLSTSINV